ncbi:Crp/Fnr family transcriptional regulator [Dysgonomonas sp.]|jgi:CRP-like cAMP-binding protein
MKNPDLIRNSIEPIISLSEEEWIILNNYISCKVLKKNDYFLKEGEICKSVALVCQGILIYSKELDNADEITTDFGIEGDWVTDNYSRLNNSPSLLNIKALADSKILVIQQKDLSVLYDKVPKLEKFGRVLMEKAFVKITQLSLDLQILSAKERYLKLLSTNPGIFQRIPLYHIANYLGIAPKSLSRIRNSISKKR